MKKTLRIVPAASAALLLALPLIGCGEDNDRKPTAAEGAAADVKRRADIDANPNLSPTAKEAMKSHITGGDPGAADAAARSGAH